MLYSDVAMVVVVTVLCLTKAQADSTASVHADICHGVNNSLYYEVSNKCYWRIQEPGGYASGLNGCWGHGGTLLQVESKLESQWISHNLPYNFEDHWIGLRYVDKTQSFVWADGRPMGKGDFTSWPGDKRNVKVKKCVTLRATVWRVEDCLKTFPCYCQIAHADPCRVQNGGCDQICVTKGLLQASCKCRELYKQDKHRCLGRCERGNGECEHICTNVMDTRNCSCRRGYDQKGIHCFRNANTKFLGALSVGVILLALVVTCGLLCAMLITQSDDKGLPAKFSVGSLPTSHKPGVGSVVNSRASYEDKSSGKTSGTVDNDERVPKSPK